MDRSTGRSSPMPAARCQLQPASVKIYPYYDPCTYYSQRLKCVTLK